MKILYSFWTCCVAMFITLFLSGCGGGYGDWGEDLDPIIPGPSVPGAPVLQWTPVSNKTFRFTWADVTNETEYILFERPQAESSFSEVARVGADTTNVDIVVFLPSRINATYILQACNDEGCTASSPLQVSESVKASIGYVKTAELIWGGENFGNDIALSADGKTMAIAAISESSPSRGVNQTELYACHRFVDLRCTPHSGAVYVYQRAATGLWNQTAYIKASNAEAGDLFGSSLVLSADGSTLAVGAIGESSSSTDQNNNDYYQSGAVYVFTRNAQDVWSEQAYLKATYSESAYYFGYSLALSENGSRLVVGSPGDSSNAIGIGQNGSNSVAPRSGAVYVFTRFFGSWVQPIYVKASNTDAADEFGHSVAMSNDGNTFAVGAYRENSAALGVNQNQFDGCAQQTIVNCARNSGAGYVFNLGTTGWQQDAYIKASNTNSNDLFGAAISLSGDGNTLAVGATGEDSHFDGVDYTQDSNNIQQSNNSYQDSGAVYVFTRAGLGTAWSQHAYIKSFNTDPGDGFGGSLSLSNNGDALAAGAYLEASQATGICAPSLPCTFLQAQNNSINSGAVYLFNRNQNLWNKQAYIKAPANDKSDLFGFSLSLSGDAKILAVGAPEEDGDGFNNDINNNDALASGAVYLY